MLKQIIEIARCASTLDEHILHDPISLSCGHYICQKCIPADTNLACNICGIQNENVLKNSKVSLLAQYLIQLNIEGLVAHTKEKIKNSFDELKGILAM